MAERTSIYHSGLIEDGRSVNLPGSGATCSSGQLRTAGAKNDRRDLKDLAILAWVICLFAALLFVVSERQKDAERDFVYFYSVGRIANEHPPEQIYNFDLQRRTFDHTYHLKGDRVYGPSPYPPFVAWFFRPLAMFTFETAFHLWQLCTLALFAAGVGLLAAAIYPKQRLLQSLIFAAALSFAPFIADTLAAGQLSAVGCFAFSLALFEQKKRRQFRSGLVLALALYKPTLLLLTVPMLLVRREWRTLAGLVSGCASLLALTTAAMGLKVWAAWWQMLVSLGHLQAGLDFSRYIDVFAFSTLLAHNHPLIKTAVIAGAFFLCGGMLLLTWLRSSATLGVWAATLTWTLFLNLYVPIYDAVLVVPAVIVSAPDLIARSRRSFTALTLLIFGISWISEYVARTTSVQILSAAVFLLGVLQLRAAPVPRPPAQRLKDSGELFDHRESLTLVAQVPAPPNPLSPAEDPSSNCSLHSRAPSRTGR